MWIFWRNPFLSNQSSNNEKKKSSWNVQLDLRRFPRSLHWLHLFFTEELDSYSTILWHWCQDCNSIDIQRDRRWSCYSRFLHFFVVWHHMVQCNFHTHRASVTMVAQCDPCNQGFHRRRRRRRRWWCSFDVLFVSFFLFFATFTLL